MALLPRAIIGFVLASTVLFACAEPPMLPGETIPAKDDPTAKDKTKTDDKSELDTNEPVEAPLEVDDTCTDACSAGAKRCSATSGGGTEICAKASTGCTAWGQGTDCAAGSSCDKGKDDGSCVAGCTNDVGCSATNLGSETCATEGGRSRIKCTKVGECFRWAAATSCSPDEACHAGTCASVPVETQCKNACTLNAVTCTGARSRQACTTAANGCTVWTATNACSPDEQCSAGVCE